MSYRLAPVDERSELLSVAGSSETQRRKDAKAPMGSRFMPSVVNRLSSFVFRPSHVSFLARLKPASIASTGS
jgi:hypothetical protein